MNGLNKCKKNALVTGCTHGIGKAAAKALASCGWDVFICGSNPYDNTGPLMEKEIPNIYYRLANVADENAVQLLMNEIYEKYERLDLAFNNAGIGCTLRLPHMADFVDFENVVRTNLIGTAICMKYEIELMLMQSVSGVIINNASISALKANTGADASYAASKAGIIALTREAAVVNEYRDKILFYTLVPGYIETRMTATNDKELWKEKLPSGRPGKPQDAADIVLRISENPVFISGQMFFVDGGDFLL